MKIQQSVSKVCKVIDAFNGTPLEKATIQLEGKNNFFIHKNGGFYITTNLPEDIYDAVVKCQQYKTKKISFRVSNDEKEIMLVSLCPSGIDVCIELCGKMTIGTEKATNLLFYYTIDCEEYKKRISYDIKKENSHIRLYTYDDISLEGHKFAIEEVDGIYTLGSYSYEKKQYKLSQNIKNTIETGTLSYFLLEGMTNENGYFEIFLPRYLIKEGETELLFFTENKSCRIAIQSLKELIEVIF